MQRKSAALIHLIVLHGMQDQFQSVIKKLKSQEFGREQRRPKCVPSFSFHPVEHCPVLNFLNFFGRFLQKTTHGKRG